ncbi:MAG TPA: hypothetical protein VML19_01120 [Verrucomicrobiae bacterium]|nr:hypothetical protein [Verrucomicrobiae bacterium]
MKGISVFMLGAAALSAQAIVSPNANFVTGQAARLVIGQSTFDAQDPNSTNITIGAAGGVAFGGNTLVIADSNQIGAAPSNNRILIYPNVSNAFPRPTDELGQNSKCPVCVGQATVVLGQPDFNTTTLNLNPTASNLRTATAVATDGVHLVVADKDHNRVLIWNRMPTANNTPADVVVGQKDFVSSGLPANNVPTAASLRGPQGVWLQNGKLFIADTQNDRILIFNHIPTANGANADVVVGQPNFTTLTQQDATQQPTVASATSLLNPVSVTSDGIHMFVTDLGNNRVLIWNSIPTTNQAAADVEIGQPDFTTQIADDSFTGSASQTSGDGLKETPVLCTVSNGQDASGNPTYPFSCNYTLNFPRFALSDGTHLFIADGGNDRILEFLTIPTQNAQGADIILGQIGGDVDQATSAVDSMNTPTSLAWDGTNLYVADPYNLRITVYTPSANPLPYQAVANLANSNVYATGTVTIGGTITAGDIVTIDIGTNGQYTYTVKASDSVTSVIDSLVTQINAGNGDPNVTAVADDINDNVALTAKVPGPPGDNVTYSATVSTSATITASAANSNLSGGGDAASVGPGTLVIITGTNLSANTATADMTQLNLPTTLGGTEVYFNGNRAPLLYVSPTEIHAQVSWVFTDTGSVNAFVRSVQPDGSVMFTSPVALTIVPANPGLFAQPGTTNPQIGLVYHASSNAVGLVSVDGSVQGGDVATVTIQDRTYNYTIQESDTLVTVRDALVQLINQDPFVRAKAAGPFQRIILTARLPGPDGDNIAYNATQNTGGSVVMTAFGSTLCCANVAGTPVTPNNPALPGEFITLYATGLGLPVLDQGVQSLLVDGQQYPANGPITVPQQSVSAIAGGSTADVLQVTLLPGTVGMFQVLLHLNDSLPTNLNTAVTIAQNDFVSNPVTFALFSPTM